MTVEVNTLRRAGVPHSLRLRQPEPSDQGTMRVIESPGCLYQIRYKRMDYARKTRKNPRHKSLGGAGCARLRKACDNRVSKIRGSTYKPAWRASQISGVHP